MNAYNGQASVIVKFSARSGYGNYLYLDNVNLSSSNSVNELLSGVSLNIFPNPAQTEATLNISLTDAQDISLSIVDVLGQVMLTENEGTLNAGDHSIKLNIGSLPSGVYFVRIGTANGTISKKITVEK